MIACSISSNAQVRVGAMAGVNFSDINNLDLVTTSRQTNLQAGLMTDLRLSKSAFHILAQALYAPMGYAKSNLHVTDALGNDIGIISSHRIGYIQVPVYLLYKGNDEKVKINAGLGPFISFKTGDKMEVIVNGNSNNIILLPIGVKKVNNVLTGIGLNLGFELGALMISLQYKQSFSDIYENRFGDTKWKINSFGLSLGYFFTK